MRRSMTMLAALATSALLALGTTAPAAAATPGSANDKLVQKWYASFLGRAAGEAYEASGGRGYWVDRLDAGEERRRILESVLSSGEFADRTVNGYYRAYLDRDGSRDPGSGYWKSGVRGDMEPEWVEQNILASPEYASKHSRVSSAWYPVVLGRQARPGEVEYWQGRVAAVGALNAVRELWYTAEAVERRIRQAYADLLGRRGNQVVGGEIDYWYDRMSRGRQDLLVDFAVTTEYSPAPTPPTPNPNLNPTGPVTQPEWRAEVTSITDCRAQTLNGPSRNFYMTVALKNTDTNRNRYVITADWLDANGNVVAARETYLTTRVEPTQTYPFELSTGSRAEGTVASCRVTNVRPW